MSKEEQLLHSAETLFAQHGFSGTSTREISRLAEANVSMISYYFGSKEKLYESLFEYRMNESLNFTKDILADTEIDEWQKLLIVINRYADRVRSLKSFYLILQREQLSNRNPVIRELLKSSKSSFLATYREIIEKGTQRGLFTKNPRLEFVHATISGTLFTAMNTLPLYKEFFAAGDDYEQTYFEEVKIHIQHILKHLLGYEESI